MIGLFKKLRNLLKPASPRRIRCMYALDAGRLGYEWKSFPEFQADGTWVRLPVVNVEMALYCNGDVITIFVQELRRPSALN